MILSKKFQDIIHGAIYLAVNELNHQYLTCEHILFCALDNKDVIKMFESFDVNISGLRNKLYQFLQYDLYDLTNKNLENNRIIKLKFTDHLVNFFERLVLRGNKNHSLLNGEIDIEDFILEILFDHESYSYFFLKKFNLNKDDLISYLKENEKKNFKKNQSKDFGSEINDFLGQSSDKFKKNSDFLNSSKSDFFSSDENFFGENFNANIPGSDKADKQKQFSQKQFSNYFGFSGKNQTSNHSNNFYNGNFSGGASGLNSSHLGYLSGLNEEKDKSKNSILENYCTNFNLAAQKGKIDPIFDRDEEIEMLLKALYCRRKGNALLIGDSGVGKTAIIEYLAQKIVNNDKEIPSRLKNALIYSLDLNSLISGTRYRGDLEERMKFLMNEIEASKQKIILFIDEIHTVIGTGSTNNGTLDIGNILKPYLARSMIYCIGATTRKEFTQFLSKDKAFLRRFQIIFVNEPSIQSAQKMITGIIGKYESYHNVKYTKGAIEASVLLCKRYISDRHLPDGALDLIDYAGSSACINSEQKKIAIQPDNINLKSQSSLITRKDIEDAIAEIIKLPKKQISSTAFAKNLLEMKDFLNTKIIGQESAIEAVCKSIIANTSEIVSSKDTNSKPIASYIFYGPTGVGKTELAIQLSNYLNMKFIRIDMSEFSESHSVSKLFGAPPGYVGFEQSGILTEQVLKNPYSVILFDEIEKAHPNLMNSLLQILDYGNLTDNFGQKVSFSHSIIICTTNSGSKSMSKITPGFNSFGNLEITLKELENSFSPEFRNRFSSIVSFKSLDSSIISKIIQSKFNEISANLKKKNIELEIDQNITQFIIDKKYDSSMGARIIDRIIEDEITSKLSKLFFESKVEKKGQIKKIVLDLNNFDQKANNDDESEKIEDNIKITLL